MKRGILLALWLFALACVFGGGVRFPPDHGRITADGAEPAPPNTPGEYRDRFAAQIAMWEKFINTSGIRID